MAEHDERISVEMTVEELGAVLGMVSMVDNSKSEVSLKDLFDDLEALYDHAYPGFDVVAEYNPLSGFVELYKD